MGDSITTIGHSITIP